MNGQQLHPVNGSICAYRPQKTHHHISALSRFLYVHMIVCKEIETSVHILSRSWPWLKQQKAILFSKAIVWKQGFCTQDKCGMLARMHLKREHTFMSFYGMSQAHQLVFIVQKKEGVLLERVVISATEKKWIIMNNVLIEQISLAISPSSSVYSGPREFHDC